MTSTIAHRGPDGEGIYVDGPVALGNRRLAILDLSSAGHQPMAGDRGTVVVTYNGEIYNFTGLRGELQALGHDFQSNTDTEVVVHAYEEWGAACLPRFNGMFAFAIWDRARRRVFIARDRYGIKPLYWTVAGGEFVFGSELKVILAHPGVGRDISYPALNEYLSFQNIFSDRTLLAGIRLLPPGHYMSVDVGIAPDLTAKRYWDFEFNETNAGISERDAADHLQVLFRQAVHRQLVSDVEVGSYLSGGIDSGSITAVASTELPHLRTFTGGFDLSSASGMELGFDERASAESLAHLCQSEHYEVVMHAGDMQRVLPDLVWSLEDLRVGQSYPNYFVARLASRFVKVVLSGVGGDELFGGYPWRYARALGAPGKEAYLHRYYASWQRLVPDDAKPLILQPSARRLANGGTAFESFVSVFDSYAGSFATEDDFVNASLYFELKTFLAGLLLVEDKLSMAHSLETRVPFLDDDLVDFAMSLPATMKFRRSKEVPRVDENQVGKRHLFERQSSDGKPILREAMRRILPDDVIARAKQGFSAPDASWFRGQSIDYINGLLRDPRARIYEFLEPRYVASVLDEHTSGAVNRRLLIWSLLSLEWWCRTILEGRPPSEIVDAEARKLSQTAV